MYHIEDCQISGPLGAVICHNNLDAQTFNDCQSRCYHLNSPCKCFSKVEIVKNELQTVCLFLNLAYRKKILVISRNLSTKVSQEKYTFGEIILKKETK